MSVRDMVVQYSGDTLSLPVATSDKELAAKTGIPYGARACEREVHKVIVYQPNGVAQTFVPQDGHDAGKTLNGILRNMLASLGVEYWCVQGLTFWNCEDGRECVAYTYPSSDGTMKLAMKVVALTPEQAVLSTVGRG